MAGTRELVDEAPQLAASDTVARVLVDTVERTWSVIRAQHSDVPPVVVTLGSGSTGQRGQLRLGHFADSRWQVADHRLAGLFIGGEGLQRGAHPLLATLLHEAAHGVSTTRGIQDTSRQGRYHNRRYAELARELGLVVGYDPALGWSSSALLPETVQR